MNKISIEITDIAKDQVKKHDYYFRDKDAALVFINTQLDKFTGQYGEIIHSVELDNYHIYKSTETHEIVLRIEWDTMNTFQKGNS